MKTILSINIGGKVFQTNNDAFKRLEKYIFHLEKHFLKEEGGDEIMEDMEARIAELLSEKSQNGALPISLENVNFVIETIGDPTDFDKDNAQSNTGYRKKEHFEEDMSKKLYRDPDNKVIFGVCAGIGNYFGIDPVIVRIGFLVALFFGLGTPGIMYLILTAAIPKARTYTEKARMFK